MATVLRNSDGSAIVELSEPIKLNGQELSRVTIPRIKGKHLVTMPVLDGEASLGVVVGWAMHVVEPKGSVEEMSPADALDVAKALLESLGKSQPTGEPPSP
jgi:hypothetical protein